MTQEEWYIVLYVLIIIPTMVIVVMEKRQPMKTVAWLLVLAFVPIVGLVFYFFFGQRHSRNAVGIFQNMFYSQYFLISHLIFQL